MISLISLVSTCSCTMFLHYYWPYSLYWASLAAQMIKNLPAVQKTWVRSLGQEDPMEEGMATHSSILAWRIPMDRRTWRATVHGVAESDTTQRLSTHMFLILYNISLWLIHFTTGSSYFLIAFSYFTQPLMQLLSDNQQFLCVWIYFWVHLSFQVRIIIFFT